MLHYFSGLNHHRPRPFGLQCKINRDPSDSWNAIGRVCKGTKHHYLLSAKKAINTSQIGYLTNRMTNSSIFVSWMLSFENKHFMLVNIPGDIGF